MSDGTNRNDNMQDYLDLLEEYGSIEPITEEEEDATELLIDVKAVNISKEAQKEEKTETIVNNTEIDLPDASPEEAVFEEADNEVSIISGEKAAEEFDEIKGDEFYKDYEVLDEEKIFGKPLEEKEESKKAYSEVKFFGKDNVSESDVTSSVKKKNKLSAWYKALPKGKKAVVTVIAVILALIIAAGAGLGIFITSKFNKMGTNIDEPAGEDVIYDDEAVDNISGQIGSNDFNQALKDWATTGNDSHMSSKNVINVLLIGADKKSNSGNTDVMMIVSVNKKTKQLKLVSFFRDSYLYINGKKTDGCNKLNAAYSKGGAQTLIETIENNYKIDIDNYVMVNFKSFEAIIDAMGGINVEVKKYEADYNYKKFKVALPVGENVKLNGKQALCFVRIRGCDADGDVSRTRRQRQVINAMLDRVMNSSISELNKYVDVLMPYVDTGYTQSQILSLGLKALTGGWAKFERTQIQMPPEDCRTSGSAGSAWIWVVDYQKAANNLQTELYGSSNILLSEGRTTIIDVYKGANYSGNSSNSSGGNQNVVVLDPGKNEVTKNNTPVEDTEENNWVDIPEDTDVIQDIPEQTDNIQDIPEETEGTTAQPTEAPTSAPTTTLPAPTAPPTSPVAPAQGE